MSTPALAIQLSDAEMRLLQALVYQECGMYFDARRTHFLQDGCNGACVNAVWTRSTTTTAC